MKQPSQTKPHILSILIGFGWLVVYAGSGTALLAWMVSINPNYVPPYMALFVLLWVIGFFIGHNALKILLSGFVNGVLLRANRTSQMVQIQMSAAPHFTPAPANILGFVAWDHIDKPIIGEISKETGRSLDKITCDILERNIPTPLNIYFTYKYNIMSRSSLAEGSYTALQPQFNGLKHIPTNYLHTNLYSMKSLKEHENILILAHC